MILIIYYDTYDILTNISVITEGVKDVVINLITHFVHE